MVENGLDPASTSVLSAMSYLQCHDTVHKLLYGGDN